MLITRLKSPILQWREKRKSDLESVFGTGSLLKLINSAAPPSPLLAVPNVPTHQWPVYQLHIIPVALYLPLRSKGLNFSLLELTLKAASPSSTGLWLDMSAGSE